MTNMKRAADRSLRDNVALVTGASSGIGAATAHELARRGARVILAARRGEQLAEHVRAITASGGAATAIPTDLSDHVQVQHLAEAALATYGRVDCLINNAGIGSAARLVDLPEDDIAEIVAVNLLAPMLLTRALLPGMLQQGHGTIISVGSVAGRVALFTPYSATKFGLRGFSLALRRQLRGTGINVCLVSPGNIRTAQAANSRGAAGPEVVAKAIADLIVYPRREIVVPRRYLPVVWLEQLLPGLVDAGIERRRQAQAKAK